LLSKAAWAAIRDMLEAVFEDRPRAPEAVIPLQTCGVLRVGQREPSDD
jgi:hypothetical protein